MKTTNSFIRQNNFIPMWNRQWRPNFCNTTSKYNKDK